MVEVLERLRTAFWSDEVNLPTPVVALPPTPQIQAQTPIPSQSQTPQTYKRTFSEPDEDISYQNTESEPKSLVKKRVRLNTPQGKIFILLKLPLYRFVVS